MDEESRLRQQVTENLSLPGPGTAGSRSDLSGDDPSGVSGDPVSANVLEAFRRRSTMIGVVESGTIRE
jgi:hypothetical protein